MHLKMIAFWTILVLGASGCGQDALLIDSSTTLQEIQFYLAPGDSAQESPNITRIDLTVYWPNIEPKHDSFPINQEQRNEQEATRLILVPIGKEVTIAVKAFEGDYAVRSGSKKIMVNEGDNTTITILLDLIPIVLRAEKDRLSSGTPLVLEVHLNDAQELFAFTCELEFNELLKPEGVTPGDFFGEDVLYLGVAEKKYWTNIVPEGNEMQPGRQEGNRLALGITRKAGADGGRGGSGAVFWITFGTIGAGDAAIKLKNIQLTTPAFVQIKVPIEKEPSLSVKIE